MVSQVLHALLTSNFVRYVRVTKKLHSWHHHGGHVTSVQFTDKMKNEEQIGISLTKFEVNTAGRVWDTESSPYFVSGL